MKQKFVIINFSLMITVLFAMLFQSLHSYEHLIDDLSKPNCHQKHDTSGTQITHEHATLEHCFACEFTFSHFDNLNSALFTSLNTAFFYKNSFFYLKDINLYYSGISYSLRGPPYFKI